MDTPPLSHENGPVTIVTMVAGYDVHLYILAVKSFCRRLGPANFVAIVANDIQPHHREHIRKHLGQVEFVENAAINTGPIQHSGTWERLVYIMDRSQSSYVIQLDCDVLFTGPIPEVLDAIAQNRPFTLADGIPRLPLVDYIQHGIDRKSDNIVISFEKQAREFPDHEQFHYIRGSSGFAGFARGAANLEKLQQFHSRGERMLGPRWREWGTEQIASNFIVANSSPDALPLPKPKYLTWERHELKFQPSLLHFLGYCRFDQGVYSRYANLEIDALLSKG